MVDLLLCGLGAVTVAVLADAAAFARDERRAERARRLARARRDAERRALRAVVGWRLDPPAARPRPTLFRAGGRADEWAR